MLVGNSETLLVVKYRSIGHWMLIRIRVALWVTTLTLIDIKYDYSFPCSLLCLIVLMLLRAPKYAKVRALLTNLLEPLLMNFAM